MTGACVLQHIRCEPPGIFAGMLRQHGIGIDTVELDEGSPLPDWRDVDLVLAMGGPMGVNTFQIPAGSNVLVSRQRRDHDRQPGAVA